MRQTYPSDISREEFAIIEPILSKVKKMTRPRKYDLYDIFCGILYVLKSGCQWRMLPRDYPSWQSVYFYLSMWSKVSDGKESLLDGLLKKINWRGPYKQWSEREN